MDGINSSIVDVVTGMWIGVRREMQSDFEGGERNVGGPAAAWYLAERESIQPESEKQQTRLFLE